MLEISCKLSLLMFYLFLAHLSLQAELLWSNLSVVRACVRRLFLQTTSPPKSLIGFWPNFTGMILGWSSFKVVQMVPVHCISRSLELKIDLQTEKLKNLLVRNHWTNFNIILQKCSLGDPLPRLFKPLIHQKTWPQIVQAFVIHQKPWPPGGGRLGWGLFFLYIYIENFKNLQLGISNEYPKCMLLEV